MSEITRELVERIADDASHKTAVKIFKPFGVDLEDADSMRAFTEDLGFIRELREARERGREQARRALWMIISGAVIAALGWLGSYFFGGHPPTTGH